jgi:hypothetical protein
MEKTHKKILPSEITSYDVLKTAAVLLMIIDHIGYYFFPEEQMFRVIGRMCVPMWFFLIGFARSRDLDMRFLIGGAILVGADFIVGLSLLPLNILFTMFLMRLVLDRVTDTISRKGGAALWPLVVLIFLLTLPTMMVFEYGALGLLLVLYGWALRQQQEGKLPKTITNDTVNALTLSAYVIFVVMQVLAFGFKGVDFYMLAGLSLLSFGWLHFFKPGTYPRLTAALGPFGGALRWSGRHTLEIYVGHLILFKIMGLMSQPERFALFQWTLFPG